MNQTARPSKKGVNTTPPGCEPRDTPEALPPVLTVTGKGSERMIPMAIPIFGGMFFELITMGMVPMPFPALEERRLKR